MPFEDWMWAIWLGIMIIMVIVECMGPALVSIWFAAGALVSLVLSLFSLIPGVTIPWWVQVIVFVVVSAIISMITHITVPDPGKKEAEGSDGQEGLE